MSDDYADPGQQVQPIGPAVTGSEAAALGRDFLVSQYGSAEAVERAIRRGRPRVGEAKKGGSPVVRARISDADFVAFQRLEQATGKTQAELVREGVHLLLERHRIAS
ncbi:hypothetical protein ACL9RL_01150 [Plantibacter sp. Mn2098]|uniref:hypothetical protein n=1 Tax=Plantibacter sp. Mn2098 TaxID=3395266 RepID=UPI003BCB6DBD